MTLSSCIDKPSRGCKEDNHGHRLSRQTQHTHYEDECCRKKDAKTSRAKKQPANVHCGRVPVQFIPALVDGAEQHNSHCIVDNRLAKDHGVQQWLRAVKTKFAERCQRGHRVDGRNQCCKDKIRTLALDNVVSVLTEPCSNEANHGKGYECTQDRKHTDVFKLRHEVEVLEAPATFEDDNGQQNEIQELCRQEDHLVFRKLAFAHKHPHAQAKSARKKYSPSRIRNDSR